MTMFLQLDDTKRWFNTAAIVMIDDAGPGETAVLLAGKERPVNVFADLNTVIGTLAAAGVEVI